ncbi:MAG: DUF481 domain-containing protein [Verrucomicrobiota bacterium]|nr:DUF481 domain-containing protein [Verrucomicrobiota bacterium]
MPRRRAHNHSLLKVILWAGILLGWITQSFAADLYLVHLKNGDRITGSILSENEKEIQLRTSSFGDLKIPTDQVQRREKLTPPPSAPVITNAPSTAVVLPPPGGPVVPTAKPSTNVVVQPNPVPPVVAKKVAEPPKPKPPKRWNTEVSLGMNLRYSARDQQEYLAVLKSSYNKEKLLQTFDYQFSYGKTEGVLSSHRMTGLSKSDYRLSDRFYVYASAGGGYDEIRKIDFQYELGPGVGYELIRSTNWNFVLKSELGATYQDQYRSDDTRQKTYSARIGKIFSWKVWDKLTADGRAEFFPNVESLSEYRLRMEGTLRYPFYKALSLNLIIIDLYDTTPPQGVSNNDLQIRSALSVKF